MLRTLLPFLPLLCTPGCCSLAELFCGPDRSPWVKWSFETPEDAMRTFLESIRRDNADRIYLCLARSYKEALGISALKANLAWEEMRRQNPKLYLAGTAEVPEEPSRSGDGAVLYDLQVYGVEFQVELKKQPYYSVRLDLGYPEPEDLGGNLENLIRHARIEDFGDGSRILIDPIELADLPGLDLAQIVEAGVGNEWKVSRVDLLQEQ